jgi:signal transduction histidine kinase/ligand-binding sensor domain-containing protein
MLLPVITASGWLRYLLLTAGIMGGLFGSAVWAVTESESSSHAGDYTIENWQVEQGLPHVSVVSIAQTPDGYLWLGTFNGLVRFDGARFTVFNEANTPALGSSGVVRLLTDPQGGLWILTDEGTLARLMDGEFSVYGPEQGLPACGAVALATDLEGSPWVVDRAGGQHRIENGRLIARARDQERAAAESHLLVTPSEPCWVDRAGVATNSTQVALRFPTGSNSAAAELTILCAGRSHEGGYWLAATSGVYHLRAGRLDGDASRFPQSPKALVAVAEDSHGNVWVGSFGDGVFRRDRVGQWQRFGAGTGLAEGDVAAVFVDREDNIWVGTFSGGLHRLKPRIFRTYDTRDGLSGKTVMSVAEDRQGRLWVAINGGGVNRVWKGQMGPVTDPPDVVRYPLVYSVLAGRQDTLWVGVYGWVALRLQGGTLTRYDIRDESSRAMTPRALFEDWEGVVWLGCDRGLHRYDAGKFTRYTRRDGLNHDEVRALAQDSKGTLYVGTHGGGLNWWRTNRFGGCTQQDGLPDNHVSALWVDRQDTVWIGTEDGGLARLRQGKIATISARDGLPSDTIGTLVEDDEGNLWMGSNCGVIRASRQELNTFLDGESRSVTFRLFNRSDGLNGIDCRGGGQPASCKAQDGRLWFATVKGLAVVDPRVLPFNALPPPVVIEEFVVEEEAVLNSAGNQRLVTAAKGSSVGERGRKALSYPPRALRGARERQREHTLEIPPGKHRLEFRFSGLSLVAPEKVRFRYRLNGLDADWVDAGSQRVASYNYVPPGAYSFEVTACNNDGVWNEMGATLGLVLLPPWWMTWWFRVLAVAGIGGLVLGWYERRLRRLRRERTAQESFSRKLIASQEMERQRIAGELHDGLGQDLLVIASQAQLGLSQGENPPATATRLKDIADTAKQALQQARRMSHNLRPGLVEELGLTKAIQATLQKAGQASGLSITINLENVDDLLASEFEVNLYRITQEILNNVLKHANASEARFTLSKECGGLRLVAQDNGKGFDMTVLESTPPDERGFGLRQIAERAKMMGGRLDIESRPGHGTLLRVEIPLRGPKP